MKHQVLGGDAYAKALGQCLVGDFGPGASDAWECLGDTKWQQAFAVSTQRFLTVATRAFGR